MSTKLRILTCLLALVTGCISGASRAFATDVSGDQSGTWTLANSPYVVTAKVVVPAGKTLTIEAGVTVKFNQGLLFDVYGNVVARGTTAAPITFTSNGSLVAGWWRCIWFDPGSSGTLENCKIMYAGSSEGTAIYAEGSVSPAITGCTISNVAGDGIKVYGKAAPKLTGTTITNCTGWPVRLYDWSALPTFQNNTFSANRYQGVRFETHTIPDSQQVTWSHPGVPYSIGRVNINARATLTLPAGLILKLDRGQIVDVYGSLVARGTAASPIIFTSLTDDTGGDTNGDRDTTRAAAGWWRNIWFDPGSSGTLENCKILYAGASEGTAFRMEGSVAPSILNSEISHVTGDGIQVYGKAAPVLTGNTISNCSGWPVHLYEWSAMPVFQGNTYLSNRYQGVRLEGHTIPDGTQMTWSHPGAPYSVGRINVNAKASLTLPAGVILKFGSGEMLDVYGGLTARGTPAQPIVFTSLRDDTGGDTNGDRDTTKAAAGNWRNIWFENGSSGAMDNCKVLYAGSGEAAGIYIEGAASPTVSHTEVAFSSGDAIQVHGTAKPVLGPNNVFENCPGFGVRNAGTSVPNAENNWWGDASGPLHPTLNAGGKGLKVSDGVDFSPYLARKTGGAWTFSPADSSVWATSVAAYSTQYGTSDYAATQALGAPNTPTDHGDYKTAWASSGADDRREFLEVAYTTPAAIVGVDIYETFNPGAVDTVQARDADGILHVLWAGQARALAKQARTFSLRFAPTSYTVKSVRITLNSPAVPGWNEIDAIGILPVGTVTPTNPAIALSASALEFVSAAVGTAAQKTLTITNPGTAGLSVTGIAISGPGASSFTVSPTTVTVAAGGKQDVTVTYKPATADKAVGTLTITHNAPGSPATVSLSGSVQASSQVPVIGGIQFPLGTMSFADRVVSFTKGGAVSTPYDLPDKALGAPDWKDATEEGYVSLGWGGTLVVEFTDNALVDQKDAQGGLDLFVFEIGGSVEPFKVYISKDGTNWISLGEVRGQPSGIDIAPFVQPGDEFRFVKLVDANAQASGSPWGGADIDAIGAIGAVAKEPPPTGPLTPKAGNGTGMLDLNTASGDQKVQAKNGVKAGDKIDVQVLFGKETTGATGFQAVLGFDPAKVKVTAWRKDGEAFASALDLPAQTRGDSVTYGASILGGTATAKGSLAILTFQAAADFSGEAEVTLKSLTIRVGGSGVTYVPGSSVVLSSGTGGKPTPDFDGSGEVDFSDFFLFAVAFGTKQGDPGFDSKYDLDGSGEVDFGDFFEFAAAFGQKI